MNKILILLISLLFSIEFSNAQYAFFSNRGKITYDKITFTRARIRDMQQQISQQSQGRFGGGRNFELDNIPESSTEIYILDFDEKSTLMYNDPNSQSENKGTTMRGMQTGGRGAGRGNGNQGGAMRIQSNPRSMNSSKIIFQDLKNTSTEVQVDVDDKYIITDSLNKITWRFTDEYRNIGGYECRRANGSTKDSLYLVAFYTDEIPVSAGPALSNGLPGMILGLIIPEMHIQYWATKVEYNTEIIKNDWKDKKAKTITIDNFVSSFGRFFQRGRDNNSSKRQVQEALIY